MVILFFIFRYLNAHNKPTPRPSKLLGVVEGCVAAHIWYSTRRAVFLRKWRSTLESWPRIQRNQQECLQGFVPTDCPGRAYRSHRACFHQDSCSTTETKSQGLLGQFPHFIDEELGSLPLETPSKISSGRSWHYPKLGSYACPLLAELERYPTLAWCVS